jgi:hypothetical protein
MSAAWSALLAHRRARVASLLLGGVIAMAVAPGLFAALAPGSATRAPVGSEPMMAR